MPLYTVNGLTPQVAPDVFIAPGAHVIGDVRIGAGSSIWFNVVVRGDVQPIRIGEGSNVQDGSVVHVTRGRFGTNIGNRVLVGHLCIVHGCDLHDDAFIGMGATVMDGCVVEQGGMVAAGALLTPGKKVGPHELWAGRPAKLVRVLDEAERAQFQAGTASYTGLAQEYRATLA
jgi:carbonic anhydrase/acetyltransferase-like protein (isoleucine patch superfamily)